MRAAALSVHCKPAAQGVSLVAARQAALWDAEIRKLFQLFDIRGNGTIQADEFCRAQLYVAQALGEDVRVDGIAPLTAVSPCTLGSGLAPPQPPLARSRTVDTLRNAGFDDVDIDGDGCIDFEEFRRWQLMLLQASASSSATKRRHLALLIRELERRVKSAREDGPWVEAEEAIEAAEGLEALELAIGRAVAMGITVSTLKMSSLLQLRAEARQKHVASLTAAKTAADLAAALEAAEPSFEAGCEQEQLRFFRDQLEMLRTPFPISVSSLAGLTCTVNVNREQRVEALCYEVGRQTQTKAYRITLAHPGGRLEPPSATLEECGVICPEVELGMTLHEIDPLKEMSLSEYLDCILQYKLTTQETITKLQKQVESNEITEDDCRARFATNLVNAVAAEDKRRREEEEARRLEQEQKAEARAERRAPFEQLAFDELVAQAVQTGLVKSDDAVSIAAKPCEHREGLTERLSLLAAAETAEAKITELETMCAELEPQVQDLVKELHGVKADAQKILDTALPALEQAYKRLKELRKSDLQEAHAIHKPPQVMMKVMEAVCRLLMIKPQRMKSPDGLGIIDDWWQPSLKHLFSNPGKFMDMLFQYDKDNIPGQVIASIQSFVEDETSDPEVVKRYSFACSALSSWVHAMYKYHFAAEEIHPFRGQLSQKEAELEPLMRKLGKHQDQLKEQTALSHQLREEIHMLGPIQI